MLHLGGVQFPVTGPLRYTMTAEDAVELSGLLGARTVIPIHYEGLGAFQGGPVGDRARLRRSARRDPGQRAVDPDRR